MDLVSGRWIELQCVTQRFMHGVRAVCIQQGNGLS